MPLILDANSHWNESKLQEIVQNCIEEEITDFSSIQKIMDMFSVIFHHKINDKRDNPIKKSIIQIIEDFLNSDPKLNHEKKNIEKLHIMRVNVAKFILKFLNSDQNSAIFPIDLNSITENYFSNNSESNNQFFAIFLEKHLDNIEKERSSIKDLVVIKKDSLSLPPNHQLKILVEEKIQKFNKKESKAIANRSLLDRSMYKYEKFISGNQKLPISNLTSPINSELLSPVNPINSRIHIPKENISPISDVTSNNMDLNPRNQVERKRLSLSQNLTRKSKIKMIDVYEVEKAKKDKKRTTILKNNLNKNLSNSDNNQKSSNQNSSSSPVTNTSDTNSETTDNPNSPLMNLSPISFQSPCDIPKSLNSITSSMDASNLNKLPDLNYEPVAVSKSIDLNEYKSYESSIDDNKNNSNTKESLVNEEIERIMNYSDNLSITDQEMINVFFNGMTRNPSNPNSPNHSVVLNRSYRSDNSNKPKALLLNMNFETGEYNIYES